MAYVTTGFSKPYVALYANAGGTNTYSEGQILARGVSVSLELDVAEDNNFYADNIVAESVNGIFQSGSLTLTVDGLSREAAALIYGLPDAGEDGFVPYGDAMQIPNVGVGYVTRKMNNGVTTYWPTILPKVSFAVPSGEAATQEDEIEFQTTELAGSIFKDDTASHNWKYEGAPCATEAEAETVLKAFLSIT